MPIQRVNTNELANTGVTAGTYGSTNFGQITLTVGADGRITSVANSNPSLSNILMLSGM